jgi:predicted HicB family RNase H-like nuclease
MNINHYTYRVTWSPEDDEHLGLCAEFPSLSWLAKTPEAALKGIGKVVADVVADMQASGEPVPVHLAEKHYSGEFRVRIPPQLHRNLALAAAVSIPVNVTADSGNVTGIPANVTAGSVLRVLILCRLAFPAFFPIWN